MYHTPQCPTTCGMSSSTCSATSQCNPSTHNTARPPACTSPPPLLQGVLSELFRRLVAYRTAGGVMLRGGTGLEGGEGTPSPTHRGLSSRQAGRRSSEGGPGTGGGGSSNSRGGMGVATMGAAMADLDL
jgi:hypothetical protein